MTQRNELLALYRIDQQMHGLESRFAEARRDALVEQKATASLHAERAELTEQVQKARAKVSADDKELAEFDARMADCRRRMHVSKSNKEYQALLLEVDSLRSQKRAFEEAALAHLAETEKREARLARLADALDEQQRREQMAEKRLARLHEEHGHRIEQLRAQRQDAAEQVSTSDRALYDRLFDNCDGEPFAAIEEQDRRSLDYSCSGCFLQVPVERVSQLLSGTELTQCPNCTRLLFIDEELHASFIAQQNTA
ncbi:MAG: C4-type zinc ribbon domain-containing protein [Phycisphaeraceae bacterium]